MQEKLEKKKEEEEEDEASSTAAPSTSSSMIIRPSQFPVHFLHSPMGDLPMSPYRWLPPLPPQPQTPPPPSKSNVPMLYYSLVVVGTAAVAVALYNLVVIRWCTHRTSAASAQPRAWLVEITGGSQSSEDPGRNLLSSFKYKKDAVLENGELECAVCLSAVEDGEEVRQLPRCKHTFHVSCIDMWLYSHSDCPLCRAPAVPPLFNGLQEPANSQENSREGLLPVVTL